MSVSVHKSHHNTEWRIPSVGIWNLESTSLEIYSLSRSQQEVWPSPPYNYTITTPSGVNRYVRRPRERVATAVDEVVGAAGDAVAIMTDVVLEAQAAMVPRWLWDPQGPPCNEVNV